MPKNLWQFWVSLWLTQVLLGAIIAFSAFSAAFLFWGQRLPLHLRYALETAGFSDLPGSLWFTFVLGLLFWNLIGVSVNRFMELKRMEFGSRPSLVRREQLLKAGTPEKYVYVDFASSITRDRFRDLVAEWPGRRWAPARSLRDEADGGELQLHRERDRHAVTASLLAHFALFLIFAGAFVNARYGFQGVFQLDEGIPRTYFRNLAGNPVGMALHRMEGHDLSGFYEAGFEVEASRIQVDSRKITSLLDFFKNGEHLGSMNLELNHPASFRGLTFHQSATTEIGHFRPILGIRDRQGKLEFARAEPKKGERHDLEGAMYRVVDIEPRPDEPAVRIEYEPKREDPEQFWVFQNHPQYDEIHRKESRYVFRLTRLESQLSTEVHVARSPGSPLIWAGFILGALFLAWSLLRSHDRCWFIWYPNGMTLVGSSTRMAPFIAEFKTSFAEFKEKLESLDSSLRNQKIQVMHARR